MKSILFKFITAIVAAAALLTAGGCSDVPEYPDDPLGNFDALAEIIDTKYCFLDDKGIDWNKITSSYRKELTDKLTENGSMTVWEYFDLCGRMLGELKDGHVNLQSRFNVSYYRQWWSDYPQDFDLRTLQQYYLKFDYYTAGGASYKILNGDIAYIYYPSFSSSISETNLDYILYYFRNCKALIIDVRNNGGGLLTNVGTFVGRFIESPICGGFIRHKTGPGHSDFSEPYKITYNPCSDSHIKWERPVMVLTNRSCFSAANNFVAVMKSLPGVKIAGSRTGGGGGMPFTSELPNGWAIRFSASPITAPDGSETESGIDPSDGYECHATDEELAAGKDGILDFAIDKFRLLPPIDQDQK